MGMAAVVVVVVAAAAAVVAAVSGSLLIFLMLPSLTSSRIVLFLSRPSLRRPSQLLAARRCGGGGSGGPRRRSKAPHARRVAPHLWRRQGPAPCGEQLLRAARINYVQRRDCVARVRAVCFGTISASNTPLHDALKVVLKMTHSRQYYYLESVIRKNDYIVAGLSFSTIHASQLPWVSRAWTPSPKVALTHPRYRSSDIPLSLLRAQFTPAATAAGDPLVARCQSPRDRSACAGPPHRRTPRRREQPQGQPT